jgi:hypothetical protein
MCAEKSAGVRYGTEAFALGGSTETLGGMQAAILKVRVRSGRLSPATDISTCGIAVGPLSVTRRSANGHL